MTILLNFAGFSGLLPRAIYLMTQEIMTMGEYRCTVCGYIYDPQAGDPDGGIEPGTPFEDLPDDWSCPVCSAEKSQFEAVE